MKIDRNQLGIKKVRTFEVKGRNDCVSFIRMWNVARSLTHQNGRMIDKTLQCMSIKARMIIGFGGIHQSHHNSDLEFKATLSD